ncbi:ferredoxin reductase family protein [Amycolatopsis acididurans]|nr:ferredoxin reductase family protein [Amycolatopsis acididurans]
MKTVHWLSALLVLNVLWATDLFVLGHGFDGGLLMGLGRLTGIYGALALVVQLVLIARLPWVEVRLGMDRLTAWHRWSGFWVLWLLIAHVVFITLGYARQDGSPLVSEIGTLVFDTEDVLIATLAMALLIAVGITSARLARRRMRYETWHVVHLLAYLAIVLGFLHQVTIGHDFVTTAVGRAYWWTLYGLALGAVALSRIGVPLLRNLRHQLRVEAVVRESADVVTIWIGGRDLHKLPARAGQFFLWRFATRWWEAHPYSLSAMPQGQHLRITVKALGDGSAWLQRIRPGTRVFAEGPYGAFTAERRTRRHVLLVAGGVGVTPIRALLEEFAQRRDDIVVIYRAREPVLAREMDAIARWCGARLHVVTGPADAQGMISALVRDVRRRDVYVCGPPGLTQAVRQTLDQLGVPESQCHFERFAFAA